jgi:hypothetical protein
MGDDVLSTGIRDEGELVAASSTLAGGVFILAGASDGVLIPCGGGVVAVLLGVTGHAPLSAVTTGSNAADVEDELHCGGFATAVEPLRNEEPLRRL